MDNLEKFDKKKDGQEKLDLSSVDQNRL